jgi:hypothetical protein
MSEAGENVWEELVVMRKSRYEIQSEFAKKYFGTFATGRAEGEMVGEARGEARAVLLVLEARGLTVSEEVRQRLLACKDIAQLDRWVERATTAQEVADLFR